MLMPCFTIIIYGFSNNMLFLDKDKGGNFVIDFILNIMVKNNPY